MKIGVVFLVLGYVLSQFYRAFLAVLTPDLQADLGATPEMLSVSSGLWFVSFAAMQVPIGWALDHVGPRKTASWLLAIGGGLGAAVFAMAQGIWAIHGAMILIGIGCAPVLMASYFIFARQYAPAVFGTLAGAMIGVGSLGNIAGSLPLAWAVELMGWRMTLWAMAGITVIVAGLLWVTIEDPEKVTHEGGQKGSLLDLLKIPALWLIIPLMLVNYAPSMGLRALWSGPFLSDVYGMDAGGIGQVTLAMGLAMIAGSFAYGPMDRLFGTRKWVIFAGNLMGAVAVLTLAFAPESGIIAVTVLMMLSGLFGASFPLMMAHGRAFFPPHLVGRGVTLMNLFGIGGVGLMQFASGPLFRGFRGETGSGLDGYPELFATFGVALLIGCAIYLFSKDRTD